MPSYEFTATGWETDPVALFIGFANNGTGQYVSLQREEGSEGIAVPEAGNVWIERDDQGWGGHGGITALTLEPGGLSVWLTQEMAERIGGYHHLRVGFAFPAEEYQHIRGQLARVMVGYPDIMTVEE